MLAPQPGRTAQFPKPIKIISKKALYRVWNSHRDSTAKPGKPGIDNLTALQFAAKLDSQLSEIVKLVRTGKFGFARLRAVFIPKPGSAKERMICIPIVRDRLVQRVIAKYLGARKVFPIYHASSFGFIEGQGTRKAIDAVIALRGRYNWCLKTDIEAFFDRIPRAYLKSKVFDCLGHHSLIPLIEDVIDCEVRVTSRTRKSYEQQKIIAGKGVRQGMPLSPLLSNLALAEFDKKIQDAQIEMVRYADDLVFFFNTKDEAEAGQKFVKSALGEIQLSIPEILDGSKTTIASNSDPLEFLGREIVYLGSQNKFVSRVSTAQIAKIKARLAKDYSLGELIAMEETFQDATVSLSRSIASYLGIYNDAFNYPTVENELRAQGRSILKSIFHDLFGAAALSSLSEKKPSF